jgi:hypothetical protein
LIKTSFIKILEIIINNTRKIINKIKDIFKKSTGTNIEEDIPSKEDDIKHYMNGKMKWFWNILQFQSENSQFNELLGVTSIKTLGDFLQECKACLKWGGYISTIDGLPQHIKDYILEKAIEPIFRSVTKEKSIIPYDTQGNALRLGIQGDRPSGFREIIMISNGNNGGINDQVIGGYMKTSSNQNPSRTLLVSRNEGNPKVIYTTREIRKQNKEDFIRSLQYIKDQISRPLKVKQIDLETGEPVLFPIVDEKTGESVEKPIINIVKPEFEPVLNRSIETEDYTFNKYKGAPLDTETRDNNYYEVWVDYTKPMIKKENVDELETIVPIKRKKTSGNSELGKKLKELPKNKRTLEPESRSDISGGTKKIYRMNHLIKKIKKTKRTVNTIKDIQNTKIKTKTKRHNQIYRKKFRKTRKLR